MGQDSYLPLKKSGQSVIDQNLPYRFLRGQPLKALQEPMQNRLLGLGRQNQKANTGKLLLTLNVIYSLFCPFNVMLNC